MIQLILAWLSVTTTSSLQWKNIFNTPVYFTTTAFTITTFIPYPF